MQMNRVTSSAIHSIGYDADAMAMYIRFTHDDDIYTFCRVPFAVYQSLMSARSKGAHYNAHIKDKYDCRH